MALVDDYAPLVVNREVLTKTILTVKCELLLDGNSMKCTARKTYRATLRTLYNRYSHRSSDSISDISSHANVRYMNTPEKKAKISKLKKRAQSAGIELSKLQEKIKQLPSSFKSYSLGEFSCSSFSSKTGASQNPTCHISLSLVPRPFRRQAIRDRKFPGPKL